MERLLNLKHTNITDLTLTSGDVSGKIIDDFNIKLKLIYGFNEKGDSFFGITFEVEIESDDKAFELKLKATSHFETNLPIDQEFKDSSFVKINAPAIAFPYVRAAISNITLNCGYNPIILPSYNFVNLAEGM